MLNRGFESSPATNINKEWIAHIQFTNLDTDSDVENTEISFPLSERLKQMRVDHYKTLFSNNLQRLDTAVAQYHLVAVL